jgi:hypothetical protein
MDFTKYALRPGGILLPQGVDYRKWAVIACDQFTSQPEYWADVEKLVGSAPSTLNMIYPEAWLHQGDARIPGSTEPCAGRSRGCSNRPRRALCMVERQVSTGTRLGLVGRGGPGKVRLPARSKG